MKISYLMYDPVPRLADLDHLMAGVAALGYYGIELVATHPLGYPIKIFRNNVPVASGLEIVFL